LVNAISNSGSTALHWAAYFRFPEITQALLNAGADINIANIEGQTPIVLAFERGDMDVVRILQAHGAILPEHLRQQAHAISGEQSVHNPAVHRFASTGASALKVHYQHENIPDARQAFIDWIERLGDGTTLNQNAKKAIAWLKNDGFVDSGLNHSNVSTQALLGLVWLGINDKKAQQGITLKDEDIHERRQSLLKRLSDIQQAYNNRADNQSCPSGAFNMLIQALAGGHDKVEFIYVNTETISRKAQGLLNDLFMALSDDDKTKYANLWQDNEGPPEGLLTFASSTIERQLRDEFKAYEDFVLDEHFNPGYEKAIISALENLQYSPMPSAVKKVKVALLAEVSAGSAVVPNFDRKRKPEDPTGDEKGNISGSANKRRMTQQG
jgi:hypothetical protein